MKRGNESKRASGGWQRRRRCDSALGSKDWIVRLTRHCTMTSTPPGPSSRPTLPPSPPQTASTSPRSSTARTPLQTAAPVKKPPHDGQQLDELQLRRGLALAPAGANEVIGTSEESPLHNSMERRPRASERRRLEDRQWQLPHADGCECQAPRAVLKTFPYPPSPFDG